MKKMYDMHTREEKIAAFGHLLDVLDELRVKCPWDRKQTNDSLRPNTIEEVYELCDALLRNDKAEICKELGDVLLHVAFYAKIGEETGDFDMADVCDKLCEKEFRQGLYDHAFRAILQHVLRRGGPGRRLRLCLLPE